MPSCTICLSVSASLHIYRHTTYTFSPAWSMSEYRPACIPVCVEKLSCSFFSFIYVPRALSTLSCIPSCSFSASDTTTQAHMFRDSCLLETQHSDQLTLQEVINAYRKAGRKMDEPLVMFYANELLRAVMASHDAG